MKEILLFASTLLLLGLHNAFALSCGNKLVDMGDRKVEVLMKCGNPNFVEKWQERIIAYRDFQGKIIKGSAAHRYVEEWTYNFGSNRFLYFLRFVNDRLSNIEEGSRGYDGPLPRTVRSNCGQRVEVGDRKIDVLMKCGPPTLKDERSEERFHSLLADRDKIYEERQSYVTLEEWTYNFGPNYFIYFIKFENGRVHKVESGDYGY